MITKEQIKDIYPDIKLIITYSNDGIFVPDYKVNETAKNIVNDCKDVSVSQGLLIDAIRVLIVDEAIKYDEIIFVFNDVIINVNKYGRLDHWPDGFCDYQDDILDKLLNAYEDKK